MHAWVINVGHWLLTKAGEELFSLAKARLLESAGLAPSADAKRSQLIDEYSRLLENRLNSRILARLDEDRLAAIKGTLAQLRSAKDSRLQHGYLANAASTFFTISNLPDSGMTGGIENRRLKAIATLGIASVHAQIGEAMPEIAESIALSIHMHRETAVAWLGEDVVNRLLTLYPESAESSGPDRIRGTSRDSGSKSALEIGSINYVDPQRQLVKDAINNRSENLVNLREAKFSRVDLSQLVLRRADFSNADLREANLSGAMPGGVGGWVTRFRNANLAKATLSGADFSRCDLRDADLSEVIADGANFDRAIVKGAEFEKASLIGASLCNLSEANEVSFIGANMEKAQLEKSYMRRSYLSEARLVDANCRSITLYQANAVDLNAVGANFDGAFFAAVDLTGASLAGAVLRGARLLQVDIEGADLRGVDFRDAKLEDIDLRHTNLEGANLRGLACTPRTAWPEGFFPAAHGVIVKHISLRP